MIPLTIYEGEQFSRVESCHFCSEPLDADRVRGHCHIVGNYRGTAHNACNLNYRIGPTRWKLPVILHNLRGYDSHLIVKALKKKYGRTRVIANNMELKLASTLSREELVYTKESCNNASQFDLVQQKRVYPYDYMDSFIRFSDTQLPPKDRCFNKLNGIHISDRQHEHARRVWNELQCKTLMDYHDFYLKSDVLPLTDFFGKFWVGSSAILYTTWLSLGCSSENVASAFGVDYRYRYVQPY